MLCCFHIHEDGEMVGLTVVLGPDAAVACPFETADFSSHSACEPHE